MSSHTAKVRRAPLLAVAAALLLLAACGSEATPVADGAYTKDSAVPTLAIPVDAKGKPCKAASGVPTFKGKPKVEMPVGPPPTELVKKDITVGTGAEVKAGDTAKVNYVGIACSTGKEFDSSWAKGREPIDAALTEGGLIEGWVKGIPGMKVGGIRQLEIPSDLAYGATGSDDIARNEALIFVIEVVSNTKAGTTTTTTAPTTSAPADGATTTTAAGGTTTTGSTTTASTTTSTTTG